MCVDDLIFVVGGSFRSPYLSFVVFSTICPEISVAYPPTYRFMYLFK